METKYWKYAAQKMAASHNPIPVIGVALPQVEGASGHKPNQALCFPRLAAGSAKQGCCFRLTRRHPGYCWQQVLPINSGIGYDPVLTRHSPIVKGLLIVDREHFLVLLLQVLIVCRAQRSVARYILAFVNILALQSALLACKTGGLGRGPQR